MYLLLQSRSFVLVPVLHFPPELLPVKLQACGVRLQLGLQGEHFFVSIWGQTLCTHVKRSQKCCALGIPLFLSSVAAWDVSSPKKRGHIKDCHVSPTSICETNKEPSNTLLLFLAEGTQTESEAEVCQPVSRLSVGTPAADQPAHVEDFSYVLYLPKVRSSPPWAARWTKASLTLLTHSYILQCVGR